MNVYDYLNKRNILRETPDEKFELFLPKFCKELESIGFDSLLNDYNMKLTPDEKDWDNLKKKEITNNYINSTSTTGMNIIKRYMPHLYEVKNYKGKSIKNMWNYKNLMKAVRTNRKSHSTPYFSEIVRQVGFTAGTSKITMYRPLLTKRIVQFFNAKNVLDVCVGWGGRMLGSLCVDGVSYTGIEPFSKTYEGLEKISDQLKLKKITLFNGCAENVLHLLLKNTYDLALTSPPYYNLEIYSDEETQSHHYDTYEEWVEKFLKPVVYGVIDKLQEGGKSCWSVKNFKTDKKYNLYDDIVKLHKDKGWDKMDIEFYVGNCIRPGLNTDKKTKKKGKEITYVFEKKC